ncbi:hypothetical protein DICVIV_04668 [Dictyocaulus viviparus]|uniref:Uncharacterized protein n=1 Tax=Dictyocaulus viviparus TaxID=29172 RepID=A0A0D8XX74_DICVI|nr:hypothetical protein DICVIV_04668 [Dictyocaulus viviparus]
MDCCITRIGSMVLSRYLTFHHSTSHLDTTRSLITLPSTSILRSHSILLISNKIDKQ